MIHKNLTEVAPRSAHELLGGYAILPRTIDKCRAVIASESGEYHFNCPLDKMLFDFKGTDAESFKSKTEAGASDEELLQFINETGEPKTDEEIAAWTKSAIDTVYYNDEKKGEWFTGECERLGINPAETTLFQMLDADDADYFNK